jgi:hypothetical protein
MHYGVSMAIVAISLLRQPERLLVHHLSRLRGSLSSKRTQPHHAEILVGLELDFAN